MSDHSLIAGKDHVGALSNRDVLNGILVGLPVFLGVYGADEVESRLVSVIIVGAGLLSSLVLMRVLGGRRMAETLAEAQETDLTSDQNTKS